MKTKQPRTNRYRRLASKYRPRAPGPLERVIRVLVGRQEKVNYLVKSGRWVPSRLVSVTIDRLTVHTHLTKKQVRNALKTLRDAELIKFERQHRGGRGWGRAFYDCQQLVWEVRKPEPDYRRLMAEADYRAYLDDRALEPERSTGGWGAPRFDEELRREVKEVLREAHADEQAAQYEYDLALEEVTETFMAGVEYVRAAWVLRSVQDQAAYEGRDEETLESISLDARESTEYLAVEGPVLAVIGIPAYRHLLPDCLQDE